MFKHQTSKHVVMHVTYIYKMKSKQQQIDIFCNANIFSNKQSKGQPLSDIFVNTYFLSEECRFTEDTSRCIIC